MSSTNCFVGTWFPESLHIRKKLIEFDQRIDPNITFQEGSWARGHYNHTRLWEYATALAFSNINSYKSILDVGGAGSLLHLYCADLGCASYATDTDVKKVKEANDNYDKLANWKLLRSHGPSNPMLCQSFNSDISLDTINLGKFDVVYCINVIEHVMEWERHRIHKQFTPGRDTYWYNHNPSKQELAKETNFVKGLARHVNPGGILVVSFDYTTFDGYKEQPKCAFMRNDEDVQKRIVEKSGLKLIGDEYKTVANGLSKDFSNRASTGIVFLKRED